MSEKQDKIIEIDIENIDTKAIKKQEMFLQNKAFEKVKNILYKSSNKIKTNDIESYRTHNTIFVNGKRGMGKTQFILSIENYLKDNNKNLAKKFYFFNPIDPTLLHDNESFLTIIVAKIMNNLEKNLKLRELDNNQKKEFYDILSDLAEAIDGVIKNSDRKTSLEYIAQDQSSLKLKEYMHNFFEKVVNILNKKKLIILIDDVDMTFDKGYEVLEVIRKYLSSPYTIPIVTGDLELYKYIVSSELGSKNKIDKFMSSEDKLDVFNKDKYKNLISNTAEDYLIKVFPQNRRVELLSLYEIDKEDESNILFKYKDKKLEIDSFYKKVEDVYILESSTNRFIKNLLSNQLRRIVQFLNGEYNKKEFFFKNTVESIENKKEKYKEKKNRKEYIKSIEKTYSLNLLEGVDTEERYIEEGLKYSNNNDFNKAIEQFNKVIKLNNKNDKVYFYLGNSYDNLGKHEEAIKSYKKAIDINPNYDDAYYNMGNTYNNLKQYKEAIESYKKSIEINPNNDSAYNNMGSAYNNLKQYKEAIESYKKAIDINPNNDSAYNNMGSAYFIMGIKYDMLKQYKEAIESYKKAIEIDPNFDLAYSRMGTTYGELEQYKEAIKSYKKAIEINPNDYQAYTNMGYTYNNLKQYKEAIESCKKAIKINPNYDMAYYNMGNTYNNLGKNEEAIESYKKLIEINPNGYIAYLNLLETDLILNNKFTENNIKNKFLENFKENKESIKKYKMLEILENINSKSKNKIDEWVKEYKDIKTNCSFEELREWANKKENKEEILDYIDIFERNM